MKHTLSSRSLIIPHFPKVGMSYVILELRSTKQSTIALALKLDYRLQITSQPVSKNCCLELRSEFPFLKDPGGILAVAKSVT